MWQVPLRTLDALLASYRGMRIDAVKMDVEGAECAILDGAASLLVSHRPRLLMIEGKNGATRICATEYARRHGYRVAVGSFGRDHNMLLVPDHHIDPLTPRVPKSEINKTTTTTTPPPTPPTNRPAARI
jgi:hypothetical protein